MNKKPFKTGDILAITAYGDLRLGIYGNEQEIFILQRNDDHTCEFALMKMDEFADNTVFHAAFYSGKKIRDNAGRFATAHVHYKLKTKVPSYLYSEFYDYIVGLNNWETPQHYPKSSEKNG